MVWGTNSNRYNRFSLRPNRPDRSYVPHILQFNGCRGSYPGIKWPVREADQSSPSSADVQINGAIPPLHLRLHGVDRDKFTVYTYMNVWISTAVCTKYMRLYTTLISERNRNAIGIISKSFSSLNFEWYWNSFNQKITINYTLLLKGLAIKMTFLLHYNLLESDALYFGRLYYLHLCQSARFSEPFLSTYIHCQRESHHNPHISFF